jgi:Transposase.
MKKRFTEEQIIQILKEQEAGERTADICRRHGVSQPTFYKWKAKFGGMESLRCSEAEVSRSREHSADEAAG